MPTLDPFTLRVGIRYLFVGASGFSRLVNVVSIVGLAIGITLMIVVASVFNGLMDERRDRLLRVVPHAFLYAEHFDEVRINRLRSEEGFTQIQEEFRGMAFMQGREGAGLAVDVIGRDPGNAPVASRFEEDESNQLNDSHHQIDVAFTLSSSLGLNVGDRVELTFIAPNTDGISTRTVSYEIARFVEVVSEIDAVAVYVDLASIRGTSLQRAGRLGWNVSVADPYRVDETFKGIEGVVTWIDEHGESFRAYQLERSSMFILMTLVLLLASFNIIAGQAMLINVKRTDIAILATMGASNRQLLGAFAIQGGLITLTGVSVGLGLGLAIASHINVIFDAFDDWLGISILEQSAFAELPARIAPSDVMLTIGIAVILGSFALVRPLRLALLESPVYVLNRRV